MVAEKKVDPLEFEVVVPSDNAQVVFSARKMMENMGFDTVRQHLIATAVSELSTNIIRYTRGGRIRLSSVYMEDIKGVEIIAQDSGPGIPDIDQALTEKFSTGNGLGLGLPSVKRIMDEFEIISDLEHGTWIRVVKWLK